MVNLGTFRRPGISAGYKSEISSTARAADRDLDRKAAAHHVTPLQPLTPPSCLSRQPFLKNWRLYYPNPQKRQTFVDPEKRGTVFFFTIAHFTHYYGALLLLIKD